MPAKPPSGDEDSSWAKFPDQSGGDQPELKHSVSIPGSEGSVSEEDVWQINPEQRTYYTNQFQRLQPEPFGLLAGMILFSGSIRIPLNSRGFSLNHLEDVLYQSISEASAGTIWTFSRYDSV